MPLKYWKKPRLKYFLLIGWPQKITYYLYNKKMKFLFGQFLGHPVGQFFGSPYHQKSYFKLGSRTFLFCRATVSIINVIFDGAPISSPSMKIYI